MGVEYVIRDAFERGKRYMNEWEAYKKNQIGPPPAYNLRSEVIADILKGNILIHAHSYRADEILMLMQVLKDYGVKKVTFQHANEAFKVAPELAAFGATASVFADWWAYKMEVYYSTAYNASILTKNGVRTSINSDSADFIRHLNLEAAKTQKYGGMSDDEALAMITINPAAQLGIEQRTGSIEVGKDADIAIFNVHPLSIYAINQMTIVDGVVRFDREADPDDMRLSVRPDGPVEAAELSTESHDRCMQGVDWLMEESATTLGAKIFHQHKY